MNDEQTTLAELRQRMAAFVSERDWGNSTRMQNLAMSLAIEAAELMEHFQWLTVEEIAPENRQSDLTRRQRRSTRNWPT